MRVLGDSQVNRNTPGDMGPRSKYLKRDVSLGPVFEVRQQQVRVPVYKIDAD